MNIQNSVISVAIAVTLSSFTIAGSAIANDTFPTRPVTWVVPFPPGGVTDSTARVVAREMGKHLGQAVIIDNRPGAAGIVGTEYVASQVKPDGYILVSITSASMATLPYLYKNLSFEPLKAFAPVHAMSQSHLVIAVNGSRPYKTLQEFVDYTRSNPGKVNFGSAGSGSGTHLAAEMLMQSTGIQMTHIPYKGSGPLIVDVANGTIDVMFDYAVTLKPMIDGGKIRALAVTGPTRLPLLPDVPTVIEAGFPNTQLSAWHGLGAPAATPKPTVDKLAAAFAAALREPAVAKYFETTGSTKMDDLATDAFREFIVSEQIKYKTLVEKAGIVLE